MPTPTQENQDFTRVAVGQVETAPAQEAQATPATDTQTNADSSAPPLTQPADTAEHDRQTPEGGAVESTQGQAEASGQTSPSDTGTTLEATPTEPAPSQDGQATNATTTPQTPQAQAGDQANQTEAQTPNQTPPTLPPIPPLDTPTSFPSNDSLATFQAELAEAIARNEGVIQNTHYTLQGIAELLTLSADTYNFYKTSAQGVESNLESVRELARAMDSSRSYFQDVLNEVSQTHNSALELHERTTQEIASKKAELLQAGETLQTGLQEFVTQATYDLERHEETQETKISEAGANQVRAIEEAGSELAGELREQATTLQTQIQTAKTQLQTELQTELSQNLQAEIAKKRAEIEREIAGKLPMLQAMINAKKTEIETAIRRKREEIEAEISNARTETEEYLSDIKQTITETLTQGVTQKTQEAITAIQSATAQALEAIRNASTGGGQGGAGGTGTAPQPPENAGQEGNANGGGQTGETPPDNSEATPTEPPAEQAPATPQEDLLPGGFKAQRAHMVSEGDFIPSSQVSQSGAPLLERVREVENLYSNAVYDVAKMDNAKWNEIMVATHTLDGNNIRILEEIEGYDRYNPSQEGLEHKYPYEACKNYYPERLKTGTTEEKYVYAELYGNSEDRMNAQMRWGQARSQNTKIQQARREIMACRSLAEIEALISPHHALAFLGNTTSFGMNYPVLLWNSHKYAEVIQEYRDKFRDLGAQEAENRLNQPHQLEPIKEEVFVRAVICSYKDRHQFSLETFGMREDEQIPPHIFTLQEKQTLLPPEQYKFLYPDLYPIDFFKHHHSGRYPENDEELNQYLWDRLGSSSSDGPEYMKEYLTDGSPIVPYYISDSYGRGEDGGGQGSLSERPEGHRREQRPRPINPY